MEDREWFYAGWSSKWDGVDYRILRGNRCDGDMVIEFRTYGWHRPKLDHLFLLSDFKGQVEENNYGENGKLGRAQGRNFLVTRINKAVYHGWRIASEMTAKERAEKEAKQNKRNGDQKEMDL